MKKQLEELQDQFAFIDMMTSSAASGLSEILLKKLLLLEVRMEPDKHAPHIHVNYGSQRHAASFRINDAVKVAGNLDVKYEKVIKKWIDDNRVALQKIWDAMKAGNENKYTPLVGRLV